MVVNQINIDDGKTFCQYCGKESVLLRDHIDCWLEMIDWINSEDYYYEIIAEIDAPLPAKKSNYLWKNHIRKINYFYWIYNNKQLSDLLKDPKAYDAKEFTSAYHIKEYN